VRGRDEADRVPITLVARNEKRKFALVETVKAQKCRCRSARHEGVGSEVEKSGHELTAIRQRHPSEAQRLRAADDETTRADPAAQRGARQADRHDLGAAEDLMLSRGEFSETEIDALHEEEFDEGVSHP